MQGSLCCCCPFWNRPNAALQAPLLEGGERIIYGFPAGNLINQYRIYEDDFFYSFVRRGLQDDMRGGWKIHISLPPDIVQVRTAWNEVILPTLVQYDINYFKIATEAHLWETAAGEDGQGKAVTIYLVYNPEFQVQANNHAALREMLLVIRQGLENRNILPGVVPEIDLVIQNGAYFSCRCDAGMRQLDPELGTFLSINAEQAQLLAQENDTPPYNPANRPDFYGLHQLNLAPAQQLAI